jgi:uncharacterized cupin superfamily protein
MHLPYQSITTLGLQVHRNSRETVALQPLVNGLAYTEVFGSEDKEHPMTCGLFTIKQGEPTGFLYPCDEFVFILEGKHIADIGGPLRADNGTFHDIQ